MTLAAFGVRQHTGSNQVHAISVGIASMCAIGLITGVPLFSQSMARASTLETQMERGNSHPIQLSHQSPIIQPSFGFDVPDGLGLPTRREPGGTR